MTQEKQYDPVNNPKHYAQFSIQPIDAIEAWDLDYCLGNAIKYIVRAEHKANELEDLKKAAWYLQRKIQRLEQDQEKKGEVHGSE